MPWYGYVLMTMALGFWGWVAAKIVRLDAEVATLKNWCETKDRECRERLERMRGIDEKLDEVRENTAAIRGYLEGRKEPSKGDS